MFLLLFSLEIQANTLNLLGNSSSQLQILQQEKAVVLKKNQELKARNVELKKLRAKLKKQVKGLKIATGILAGTTIATFTAGFVNKSRKATAEERISNLINPGKKDGEQTDEEILHKFTVINKKQNQELITHLEKYCGPDDGTKPKFIQIDLWDAKNEKRKTGLDEICNQNQIKGALVYIKKHCLALKRLDIGNNYLTTLPDDFVESLPELTHLYVSFNPLTKLPTLPNDLIELYVTNTKIEKIASLPNDLTDLFVATTI